jgi:hypothetical protein
MKHRFLSACFLCCLPVLLSAGLVFETTEVNLEAGLLDEKVAAVFPFRNEGTQPVRIERTRSSCGCTVPMLAKKVYQPGESGEIRAEFTFGSRVGEQEKHIYVSTDESVQKPTRLTLRTDIPRWAEREPALLLWRTGEAREPKEVRVKLHPSGRIGVRLWDRVSPDPFTIKEVRRDRTTVVYEVAPPGEDVARATKRVMLEMFMKEGETPEVRRLALNCLVR